MAKFKFIGQAGERAKDITVFGIDFPAGKAVDVLDAPTIKKLQGNQEFEQVTGNDQANYTGPVDDGKQPKVAPAPDAAARAAAERAQHAAQSSPAKR